MSVKLVSNVGAEVTYSNINITWKGNVTFPDGYQPSAGERNLIDAFQTVINPNMDLEWAVKILNQFKHLGCATWWINGGEVETSADLDGFHSCEYGHRELTEFEAISIATALLRK